MNIPKNEPLQFTIAETLLKVDWGIENGPVEIKYQTTGFYDGTILVIMLPRHPEKDQSDVWTEGPIMMPMKDKDGEYYARIDNIDRKIEIMTFKKLEL
ncbi:MAG: hypothetical protein K6E28_11610 [Eubacterium sp.]|nr:hypothetical protein [Eubacterium sp.]